MSRQSNAFARGFYADLDAEPLERFTNIVYAVDAGTYGPEVVAAFGEALDGITADLAETIRRAYRWDGSLHWEVCASNECLKCTECVAALHTSAYKFLNQAAITYGKIMDSFTALMKFEAVSGEATETSQRNVAEYARAASECANRIKILSM